jgi:uncharacterized protein
MKIGLMSDTHSHLDKRVLEFFSEVDEIWHAGDFGNIKVVEQLEKFKKIRGVWGNIDGTEIRQIFPEELIWEEHGLKIYMIHIGGYPGKNATRIKERLLSIKPDLFICGHSHICKVIPDKKFNLLHINPGACGKEGWHKVNTILRFQIKDGKVKDLELMEWARGKGESLELKD